MQTTDLKYDEQFIDYLILGNFSKKLNFKMFKTKSLLIFYVCLSYIRSYLKFELNTHSNSSMIILVSETARKALWTCLVDEPTLIIRFFFEKLSHKQRRVSFVFHYI